MAVSDRDVIVHSYRAFIDKVDEGFCVIEVIGGETEGPIDYRFLETNASFERQTGLLNAVGRRMRELEPSHQQHWFDRYERIARTQMPERFEDRAEALGRWYDVYAFPIGRPEQRRVAILSRDVMGRKKAEAALTESEERNRFLLKLSDALRPLADASEIQSTTAYLTGEHLNVDRVMYAEVEGEHGAEEGTISGQYVRAAPEGQPAVVPFPEHFNFGQFGQHTMAARYRGEPLIVADVQDDPAFSQAERDAWAAYGVRAAVVATLAKGGNLVAEFGVHSTKARGWTDAEISLIQDVAERTWSAAERARAETALRESEERFAQFATSTTDVLWIRDADTMALEYISPAFESVFGVTTGAVKGGIEPGAALVDRADRERVMERLNAAARGEPQVYEFRIMHGSDGGARWIRDYCFPLIDEIGRVARIGGIARDVTELKLAEEALRESEERQAFLLKLSDALRAEPAHAIIGRAVEMLVAELKLDLCYVVTVHGHEDRADVVHQFHRSDMPDVPTTIRLSDFPQAFVQWQDRTLVSDDMASDPALTEIDRRNVAAMGFGALIAAPVRRGAGNPIWSVVAVMARPRRWTASQVALVEETAERTWAAVERAKAEEALRESEGRARLLLAELQHRVRNILAMIRSVVTRTASQDVSAHDYAQHLAGRLDAMARTQGILTRRPGEGVEIEDLVRDELVAQAAAEERFQLTGPPLLLWPKAAEVLTLAVHELATNSIKYGALASDGRLRISWDVEARNGGEKWLTLVWEESGVESNGSASRQGFGTELITKRVPYELEGTGALNFEDDTMQATIAFPLRSRGSVLETGLNTDQEQLA